MPYLILAWLIALGAQPAPEHVTCVPGTVTMYEDASYTVSESSEVVTCITHAAEGEGFVFHEYRPSRSQGVMRIRTHTWEWGTPFPEAAYVLEHSVRLPE